MRITLLDTSATARKGDPMSDDWTPEQLQAHFDKMEVGTRWMYEPKKGYGGTTLSAGDKVQVVSRCIPYVEVISISGQHAGRISKVFPDTLRAIED